MAAIAPLAGALTTDSLVAAAGLTRQANKSQQARAAPVWSARPPLTANYQYLQAIRQVVVTLQRPDTGEVVTQIPPEQIVNLILALSNLVSPRLDARA
jgi:hypothetical protein